MKVKQKKIIFTLYPNYQRVVVATSTSLTANLFTLAD
jgi:hypothetical protein